MYPISAEVISLLKRNYRQIVSITGTIDGQTVELTESNIAQGGLSINRYCLSGSKIEIGSAIAGELTLKLDNRDDRYANTHFEGVEFEVKIGIKKWDAYRWENAQLHWIPCGFFTVDETPRKLSYITLTALDRMVRFDKEVDPTDVSFPTTIANLLTTCCANCGVTLKTLPSSLTNANYVVSSFPETDELTYRRLIQWIAEISGTCAYIDYEGKLVLAWYSSVNDVPITPADRYSSDMYEQDITITGVQISDNDDNIYLAGTDDYAFNIENNDLIQHDYADVAAAIYQKVKDFTYRPYSCSCKPLPYAYPLDGVIYTDKNGVQHKSIVTGITFKMNASTQLEGKGETNIRNGYASANPLTKGEAIVVKKLENRVNRKINGVEQASLDMNELMSNSLGLYRTAITENNGSISYYYHNASTLAASDIIYSFKASGFAWTDDWNNGNPTWQYGITKNGNAIFNILSVYKLTADQIDTNSLFVGSDFSDSVVSIINGTVTAEYINAKGITANSLSIKDTNNQQLFLAANNAVQIGGYTVTSDSIKKVKTVTDSYVDPFDGQTHYFSYENGIRIQADRIEILNDQYGVTLESGMINIATPELRYNRTQYYPLMSFYEAIIDENGHRIPALNPRYYIVATKTNDGFTVNPTWKLEVTDTLDFSSGGSGSGGTIAL